MSTLTPQTCVLLEHLLASYRRAELAFGRIAIEIQPDRLQGLLRNYAQMRSQLAAELEGALHHFRSAYHPHSVPSANDFVPGRGAGDSDVGSASRRVRVVRRTDPETLSVDPASRVAAAAAENRQPATFGRASRLSAVV